MLSFKGILKSLTYVFVAGWMFFLGILVGRGTSPVTFDTQEFQKRLEIIAHEFGKRETPETKIDLEFYDALTQPVRPEVLEKPVETDKPVEADKPVEMEKQNTPVVLIPPKEIESTPEPAPILDLIPVKTSKKAATRNKGAGSQDLSKAKSGEPADPPAEQKIAKAEEAPKKPEVSAAGEMAPSGRYTIQIAAYTSFMDTITHMVNLEDKGFPSYRIRGEKNGVTWYRIRVGSFETHEQAAQFVERLNKAKINGIIIKKE